VAIYRLFYISTAAAGIDHQVVDEIVGKAVAHNLRAGISGLLGFNGVNFAQVIEGNQSDVFALMDRIRADTRHDGVIVINQNPVHSRRFGDWGMKQIEGLDFTEFVEAITAG